MTRKEAQLERKQKERETLSAELRKVYEESGLTVKEISKITGIKFSTLTSWLTGTRYPKPESAKYVITKIKGYFSNPYKKIEYINKGKCRNLFIDKVYKILTTLPAAEHGKALVDAYDSLPSVSVPKSPTKKNT